ncbi:Flp family type IVb pilin [Sphingomonas sp. Xoc002]|uniref:Flp family type IVb pilin n=1 Tax=Sphingomonas sp. Xoc002 TaxID=2837624 RepID=UPI003D17DF95
MAGVMGVRAITKMLQRLLADSRGASAVEYGLIVAAVMLVMIVGLSQFGLSLENLANRIATELNRANH